MRSEWSKIIVMTITGTIRSALGAARSALADHETDTPALDTALLLAHVLGISREKLYMELDSPLPGDRYRLFQHAVGRRAAGEPVAWITGVKEFYGIPMAVGPGVLCPRPDSEILVEAALEAMDGFASPGCLHDCCTGPGTLAVPLAALRPEWRISASDISREAEYYFERNNECRAGRRVTYIHSNLMESVPGPLDMVIANPPYLTPAETAERTLKGRGEPAMVLNGGDMDGLGMMRRLIPQIAERLGAQGIIILEADPLQMRAISRILSDNGFGEICTRRDLGERERVIRGRRERRSDNWMR